MQEVVQGARRYRRHVEITTTVLPTKSKSDVVFSLQLMLNKILTCTLLLIICESI